MRVPLVLGYGGQFQQQPGWQVASLDGTTIDKDTWVTLLEEGQPLVIPASTTWLFNAWVVGRGLDSSSDAGFAISGVITRDGGLTGTQQTVVARAAGSMRVQATHDVLNGALAIRVKGIKDEDVLWAARVEVTPITG